MKLNIYTYHGSYVCYVMLQIFQRINKIYKMKLSTKGCASGKITIKKRLSSSNTAVNSLRLQSKQPFLNNYQTHQNQRALNQRQKTIKNLAKFHTGQNTHFIQKDNFTTIMQQPQHAANTKTKIIDKYNSSNKIIQVNTQIYQILKESKNNAGSKQMIIQKKNQYKEIAIKPQCNEIKKLLLKTSDKMKMIFWNNFLLQPFQNYLIVSADFIINQDNFWESGKGLASQQTERQNLSNTGFAQPSCLQSSTVNNKNRLTGHHLAKQWKLLHKNHFVIWVIRRQNSYKKLYQLSNLHNLPLHGVFYIRRKRNYTVDYEPILKQIRKHQKLMNESLNVKTVNKNQNNQNLMNQINVGWKVNNTLNKTNWSNNGHNFIIKKRAQTARRIPHNDKYSTMNLNSFKNKQKNQKNYNYPEQKADTSRKIIKCKLTLLTQTQQKYQQRNTVSANNHHKDLFNKNCSLNYTQQNKNRQIIIFQTIKVNACDYCQMESYRGRIPILCSTNSSKVSVYFLRIDFKTPGLQTLFKLAKQLEINQQNLNVNHLADNENNDQNDSKAKPFSVKFYKLDSIIHFIKQNVNKTKKLPIPIGSSFQQKDQNQNFDKNKNYKVQKIDIDKYWQTFQNNDSQYDAKVTQIQQKTQKKLQNIKKHLIDEIIRMKGRNFTFSNGQSVHYYVGDIFKRNYQLLFDKAYQSIQEEEVMKKNRKSQKNVQITSNCEDRSSKTQKGNINKVFPNNKQKKPTYQTICENGDKDNMTQQDLLGLSCQYLEFFD